MKNAFIKEAVYRLTDKEAKKPPFFKKLQRISALVIATGFSVIFAPGALVYGLATMGFGLGVGIAAELTTKISAQEVTEKTEQKAEQKAAQKEAEKSSLKTENK